MKTDDNDSNHRPVSPPSRPLPRRTVLQGLGVTMCLPFLEALEPRSARASVGGGAGGRKRPIRFAALYMPNGVNVAEYTPAARGTDWELSPTLAPLANVKSHLLVLGEMMNKSSIQGDGHYVKVAPFLTGTAITKTTGGELRVGGISLDQLIAQRVGNLTPLPSLELSVEPVTMGVDTNVGFTRIYGSHISWNSPTTPMTREINPQLAFDRLFRSKQAGHSLTTPRDRSVLDAVMDDARRLQNKVGKMDSLKLQEYFEAVRAVEKRIAYDATRRAGEYGGDPLARKEVEKLGGRIHDYYNDPAKLAERGIDHTEQVRLMLDIMVLAFWTDSTRVATFMFGNEVSGKNFSFLPGVKGGHHEISHHEKDPEKLAQYARINQWHYAQYAYLLERMQAVKEGDGTLLDNSMVLMGSGMKDGNGHVPFNLPIVLAGKGGGSLATNRHLVYEAKTPLCNLYRSVLKRMDLPVTAFGDSTGELPGLSDPTFKGVAAPV
ncbi:MAG: DUF1552 domain-containing protein [Armatimonadota bacterium]